MRKKGYIPFFNFTKKQEQHIKNANHIRPDLMFNDLINFTSDVLELKKSSFCVLKPVKDKNKKINIFIEVKMSLKPCHKLIIT